MTRLDQSRASENISWIININIYIYIILKEALHFTCCFSFFQNIGSHREKAGERRGVGAVEVPSIISSGKILL